MLVRNSFFNDFFGDMFDDPFYTRGYAPQTQLLRTDIRERDGQYLLEIEVPGFSREDVKAELKDGYLTITADGFQTQAFRCRYRFQMSNRHPDSLHAGVGFQNVCTKSHPQAHNMLYRN